MLVFNDNVRTGTFFLLFLLKYIIQHCCICRPTDSTVSEDAGIKPNPGLFGLWHWQSDALTTWLDVIQQELPYCFIRGSVKKFPVRPIAFIHGHWAGTYLTPLSKPVAGKN